MRQSIFVPIVIKLPLIIFAKVIIVLISPDQMKHTPHVPIVTERHIMKGTTTTRIGDRVKMLFSSSAIPKARNMDPNRDLFYGNSLKRCGEIISKLFLTFGTLYALGVGSLLCLSVENAKFNSIVAENVKFKIGKYNIEKNVLIEKHQIHNAPQSSQYKKCNHELPTLGEVVYTALANKNSVGGG